jgi:ferredoxin-like protein FixX
MDLWAVQCLIPLPYLLYHCHHSLDAHISIYSCRTEAYITITQQHIQLSYRSIYSCHTGAYITITQKHIQLSYRSIFNCHTEAYTAATQKHIQLSYRRIYNCHTGAYTAVTQKHIQLSYRSIFNCHTEAYSTVIQKHIQLSYRSVYSCHTEAYITVIQQHIQLSHAAYTTATQQHIQLSHSSIYNCHTGAYTAVTQKHIQLSHSSIYNCKIEAYIRKRAQEKAQESNTHLSIRSILPGTWEAISHLPKVVFFLAIAEGMHCYSINLCLPLSIGRSMLAFSLSQPLLTDTCYTLQSFPPSSEAPFLPGAQPLYPLKFSSPFLCTPYPIPLAVWNKLLLLHP